MREHTHTLMGGGENPLCKAVPSCPAPQQPVPFQQFVPDAPQPLSPVFLSRGFSKGFSVLTPWAGLALLGSVGGRRVVC